MTRTRAAADKARPAKHTGAKGTTWQLGVHAEVLRLQELAGNRAVTSAIQRLDDQDRGLLEFFSGGAAGTDQRTATPETTDDSSLFEGFEEFTSNLPDLHGQPSASAPDPHAKLSSAEKAKARRLQYESFRGNQHGTGGDEGMAQGIFKNAWEAEFWISQTVAKAVEASGSEGRLEGEDFVQKEVASLKDKIERDGGAPMKDSVRYTAIFSKDDFIPGVQAVFKSLLGTGGVFTKAGIKNTFGSETNPYWGINTNWKVEFQDGVMPPLTMEIQFHTQESFDVKQVGNHTMYEKARHPGTPKEEKARLTEQMFKNTGEALSDKKWIDNVKKAIPSEPG